MPKPWMPTNNAIAGVGVSSDRLARKTLPTASATSPRRTGSRAPIREHPRERRRDGTGERRRGEDEADLDLGQTPDGDEFERQEHEPGKGHADHPGDEPRHAAGRHREHPQVDERPWITPTPT